MTTNFEIKLDDDWQAVWAEGTVIGMRGERGAGFFRLILAVRLHINPVPERTPGHRPHLTGLTADVFVNGVNLGRFVAHPWRWGVLEAGPMRSHSSEVYLECDLDRGRLEAIEDLRGGRDLPLHVQVQAQVDDGRWQGGSVEHAVNQSAWNTVLEAVGYRRALLIEVPVPDSSADPELAAAVAYLAQAQAHLCAGRDRDAVGSCRDVLEELKKLPGADLPEPGSNQNAWSKAERVMKLRQALTKLTHPARHRDEDAARIIWSRIDAQAVVTMTAGLIMEMTADEARRP
jgi:hypothetical protein